MKELLKEWQNTLGLNDWHIVLTENCTIEDIGENAGYCDYDDVNKCANISLLSEKQYGDRIIPYDKEKTLVHELLHVKFWFLDQSESLIQNRMVHQLINDMARALVSAKRSRNGNI